VDLCIEHHGTSESILVHLVGYARIWFWFPKLNASLIQIQCIWSLFYFISRPFVDASTLGEKVKLKLNLFIVMLVALSALEITFYWLDKEGWKLAQSFSSTCSSLCLEKLKIND
jgi:hypothetical protein